MKCHIRLLINELFPEFLFVNFSVSLEVKGLRVPDGKLNFLQCDLAFKGLPPPINRF